MRKCCELVKFTATFVGFGSYAIFISYSDNLKVADFMVFIWSPLLMECLKILMTSSVNFDYTFRIHSINYHLKLLVPYSNFEIGSYELGLIYLQRLLIHFFDHGYY